MVAGEGPYTFAMDMFKSKLPLNMTVTTAPVVANDIITINFDGHFYDPETNEPVMESLTSNDYPPVVNNTLRE